MTDEERVQLSGFSLARPDASRDFGQFGVLVENLERNNRLLADGLVAVNERLDRFEGRFDGIEGRFDGLDAKVDLLTFETQQRFKQIETKVDGLANETQRRFTRIEVHLELNRSPSPSTKKRPPARRRKKQ